MAIEKSFDKKYPLNITATLCWRPTVKHAIENLEQANLATGKARVERRHYSVSTYIMQEEHECVGPYLGFL